MTFLDKIVWDHFFENGEIVEIRIPKAFGKLPNGDIVRRQTVCGYFDNYGDFVAAIKVVEILESAGVYFSLQTVDRRLLSRAFNRLKISDVTTADSNVLSYRWLPLDFDPVRPSGISSSDRELMAAIALRDKVAPIIQQRYSFPDPLLAMSGNGAHALFRLPDWPADAKHQAIVKGLLNKISTDFSTHEVNIDPVVFNPARIWKLYGTVARKGDAVPAGEFREARPHRESYIESLGGNYED